MMDVNVSGTVHAALDEVFRFLADLRNWPRWQSDMQTTELLEGQPGARYRYVSRAMGQTFNSTVRLVRVDPPREVARRHLALGDIWASTTGLDRFDVALLSHHIS